MLSRRQFVAGSGLLLPAALARAKLAHGGGAGAGGPSAPSGLLLAVQGSGNNYDGATTATNYQTITWTAAAAGTYPISSYNVYRNGGFLANIAAPCQFQGYISGNVLTVTSVVSGTVLPCVRYQAAGIAFGTMIACMNGSTPDPTQPPQKSGTAGGVGTYGVNVSQTLGSSGSPVTFTAWQYIDSTATGNNDPTYANPLTAYAYSVSAVDSHSNEGPQQTDYRLYGYKDGFSFWSNADFGFGSFTENYSSTAGSPQVGTYCLSLNTPTPNSGGINPVSESPQCFQYDLNVGAFGYFVIDINPGTTGITDFEISCVMRIPPGDNFGYHSTINVFDYGPAPQTNTWATYKVPMSAFGYGNDVVTASISGTTLITTVDQTGNGLVDSDGVIFGAGVPTGTYTTGYGQSGPIGTFTVAGAGISGSTSVSSRTMTFQRAQRYKQTMQAASGGTIYLNNIGFTVN